jgi:hypothetical protein
MLLYETFTDHSTHLGNLLAATGNNEMSNNMTSYMTDQKVFIKTFYSSGGFYDAVEREYSWELSVCVAPLILYILHYYTV